MWPCISPVCLYTGCTALCVCVCVCVCVRDYLTTDGVLYTACTCVQYVDYQSSVFITSQCDIAPWQAVQGVYNGSVFNLYDDVVSARLQWHPKVIARSSRCTVHSITLCFFIQRCKCMDVHRSGERTPSGPVKGTTGDGANWSHEGLNQRQSKRNSA